MKISGKASVVLCTNNKKKAFRYDASQVMHTISFDFIKIFIFGAQNFNFDQTYLSKYKPRKLKCGRVKPKSYFPY